MQVNQLLFIILSTLSLHIISCTPPDKMIIEDDPIEPSFQSYSYLALGDSYTIGQSVPEFGRWPVQLKNELLDSMNRIGELQIIAKTGWTTSQLISAIEFQNPAQHDLVSLLIGVNNQYQQKPFTVFETEFPELMDIALQLTTSNDRLFVVSIPDYGVTPFGSGNSEQIAQELDMYNLFMKTYCDERNIPFIDITEISRDLKDNPDALASDNLHPSSYQYGLWVNNILPVVIEMID